MLFPVHFNSVRIVISTTIVNLGQGFQEEEASKLCNTVDENKRHPNLEHLLVLSSEQRDRAEDQFE